MLVTRSLPFLQGGGAAAREIREIDWADSPLGPVEAWPASLKTAVGTMLASRFPQSIFWGSDYIMFYNDAYGEILGNKLPAMGRRMRDVWAEVWDDVRPIAEKAMQGEATFIEDFPLEIMRGGFSEQCYFTFCYSPIREENGSIAAFLNTVIETTGKVNAENALLVQNAELSHRIRNTLAIVSSIARQTLRGAASTTEAWTILSARFAALAETHGLLRAGLRSHAVLEDVVRSTLRPHAGDDRRFRIAGPVVNLPERQALALSLAVNELATNAVKYGALANDEGIVAITWAIVDGEMGPTFRFRWQESGGPPVSAPTRRSFGTRLVSDVVPQDFGGSARLEFNADGLLYDLWCDAARLDETPQPSAEFQQLASHS